MGSRLLVGLLLATTLSAGLAELASAGVHMIAEIQDLRAGTGAPRRAQIWVEESRVRIEDSAGAAGSTWSTILYHGDQDVFFGLDPEQRSYVRIDRPTLAAIGAKIRMLRLALDSRLANLSSGQRAIAARIMGSSETPSKPVAPLVTHDTGDRELIGGRDCRVVEIRRAGRSVGMAWVASWDQVALGEESLWVFGKLGGLLGEMTGTVDIGEIPTELFEVFEGFDGLPMQVRWTRDGRVESEVHFTSVVEEETPSELFEVPADYRLRAFGRGAPASLAPAREPRGPRSPSSTREAVPRPADE